MHKPELLPMLAVILLCMPSQIVSAEEGLGCANAHTLSEVESFGFFSEPDEYWKRRKSVHRNQLQREHEAAALPQIVAGNNKPNLNLGHVWWQWFFEPSFSCPFEERIGPVGEGGKWVCDPYKLRLEEGRAAPPCLVYSVGSNGEADFEQAVHDHISAECEIHTFDINPWEYYTDRLSEAMPSFMNFHVGAIGVSGESYSRSAINSPWKDWMVNHHLGWIVGSKKLPDARAKSIADIVRELGHTGRTINLFKIDCEGCEYATYREWFGAGVDIQQVLVELHWQDKEKARGLHEFMQSMGYVIFHKEPNTFGCQGDCIEYAYIKLSSEFSRP